MTTTIRPLLSTFRTGVYAIGLTPILTLQKHHESANEVRLTILPTSTQLNNLQ